MSRGPAAPPPTPAPSPPAHASVPGTQPFAAGSSPSASAVSSGLHEPAGAAAASGAMAAAAEERLWEVDGKAGATAARRARRASAGASRVSEADEVPAAVAGHRQRSLGPQSSTGIDSTDPEELEAGGDGPSGVGVDDGDEDDDLAAIFRRGSAGDDAPRPDAARRASAWGGVAVMPGRSAEPLASARTSTSTAQSPLVSTRSRASISAVTGVMATGSDSDSDHSEDGPPAHRGAAHAVPGGRPSRRGTGAGAGGGPVGAWSRAARASMQLDAVVAELNHTEGEGGEGEMR